MLVENQNKQRKYNNNIDMKWTMEVMQTIASYITYFMTGPIELLTDFDPISIFLTMPVYTYMSSCLWLRNHNASTVYQTVDIKRGEYGGNHLSLT